MIEAQRRRRVAISGIGAVTPLGPSFAATWDGVLKGRVPAAAVSLFQAKNLPCNFAYEVRDLVAGRLEIPREWRPYLNRASEFGLAAFNEAWADAGVASSGIDPSRIYVHLGAGVGSPSLAWYDTVYFPQAFEGDEFTLNHRRHFPCTLGSLVSALCGAKGGSLTVNTACSSSGQAIGEAFDLIAFGDADVVVTGGADSMINPLQMAGFCLLGALSKRCDDPKSASRPFDRGRDGFVLGEGAAILVLEAMDQALARGAKVYGEICGYGVTESAYRITDVHPEGRGIVEAMQAALAEARIEPGAIAYLNAHGTSTPLNDSVESLAIRRVFGDDAPLTVSSTKSMTGHLIAAAGAIELALCAKALATSTMPPSVNLFEQDPQCLIRLASARPEPLQGDYALSNSIGFGGTNTSLVVRRARGELLH